MWEGGREGGADRWLYPLKLIHQFSKAFDKAGILCEGGPVLCIQTALFLQAEDVG